jgi:hypothetical protein
LRNGDNLIVPFCRFSITNSSFIPSTVKEWNKLDIAIRKLDSVSQPVSAYKYSDFVKMGKPVTILAASN